VRWLTACLIYCLTACLTVSHSVSHGVSRCRIPTMAHVTTVNNTHKVKYYFNYIKRNCEGIAPFFYRFSVTFLNLSQFLRIAHVKVIPRFPLIVFKGTPEGYF